MDIVKGYKGRKTFCFFQISLLASFQKRIAEKFDIVPGLEMVKAIEAAQKKSMQGYIFLTGMSR